MGELARHLLLLPSLKSQSENVLLGWRSHFVKLKILILGYVWWVTIHFFFSLKEFAGVFAES